MEVIPLTQTTTPKPNSAPLPLNEQSELAKQIESLSGASAESLKALPLRDLRDIHAKLLDARLIQDARSLLELVVILIIVIPILMYIGLHFDPDAIKPLGKGLLEEAKILVSWQAVAVFGIFIFRHPLSAFLSRVTGIVVGKDGLQLISQMAADMKDVKDKQSNVEAKTDEMAADVKNVKEKQTNVEAKTDEAVKAASKAEEVVRAQSEAIKLNTQLAFGGVGGRRTIMGSSQPIQPTQTNMRAGASSGHSPTMDAALGEEGQLSIQANDPNHGLFGGAPVANGLQLQGKVYPYLPEEGIYRVELSVSSVDPSRQLTGNVEFHLHPTFRAPKRSVPAQSGVAKLTAFAWGAFTVGAIVNGQKLELDLSTLPDEDAPPEFKKL